MKTCWRLAGFGALAVVEALAQGLDSHRGFPLQGEISSSTPIIVSLTVELSPNGGGPTESANVKADGTFEFRSAPPGSYELRVSGPGGAIIHRELVFITGSSQLLSIRLPDPPNARRSADSTVSLRQLSHKIPAQAKKAFEKGEKAAAKGNQRQAVESFRQAVAIDPEYVDAFTELGAAEAAMGDLPNAARDFQKAIDLVPDHPLALPNLSIVLAKLRRFREAAEVARRALKIAPASGRIRYILAASLLSEKGDTDEVLDNMERATSEVPKAHLVAADILAQRGRSQDAIRHLEEYLRAAPPDDKERGRAEARLAELRR